MGAELRLCTKFYAAFRFLHCHLSCGWQSYFGGASEKPSCNAQEIFNADRSTDKDSCTGLERSELLLLPKSWKPHIAACVALLVFGCLRSELTNLKTKLCKGTRQSTFPA